MARSFPIKRVNYEFLPEQRRPAMGNRFPRNLRGRARRYRRRLSNDAFEDASPVILFPGRLIGIEKIHLTSLAKIALSTLR